MKIGVPKETRSGETRVAATPDSIKRLGSKIAGVKFLIETGAGTAAHFPDESYKAVGAEIVDRKTALGAELVLKLHRPDEEEVGLMSKGALLLSTIEPFKNDGLMEKLAARGVDAIGLELIPRISRAQSMDVLSSQANIAGYRAVIEAAAHFGRFLPTMMTAAGSAKAAKVIVLGAGVAGLQAIATARRMGANVEAFDVRPEVKEQIESLGAKFIEIDIGESGSGAGGYAKELSPEAKAKQQKGLTERLKKADIVITTAQIPGRPAPLLVTEEAVMGMAPGSVIMDMAASTGGNCALTEAEKIVVKNGVTLIGTTNLLSLVPADASNFYARNLVNLMYLIVKPGEPPALNLDLQDEIVAASLVTHGGAVRFQRR
ncbi:Re/Si-specific NAD(P)(+) transhydrogenase subunit alpha [bacterium]|nr:Re/Si-specific NAD(P)(+) transhydrogenase subunit alpha [bacterium]